MRRPGLCVHLSHKPRAVLRAALPGPMYSKVTNHTGARTPSREGTEEEILFSSQDAFSIILINSKNFIVCKRDSLWLEVSTAACRPPCFLTSCDTISPTPDTLAQSEPWFSKTTIFLRAFAVAVLLPGKHFLPLSLLFGLLWGACQNIACWQHWLNCKKVHPQHGWIWRTLCPVK